MAQVRSRFLSDKLQRALGQAPTVCLLGMRQVGKTTLLKSIAGNYVSLDDDRVASQFRMGNYSLLDGTDIPVVIDECQKAPGLFDAVKLRVDQKKQMGRYVLTGSVRFLSKRDIKESLTGRTLILELLPLTLAESHERPQVDFLERLVTCQSLDRFIKKTRGALWVEGETILTHLSKGGLPGICFKRDPVLRREALEVHLETLLSRDLTMIYQSRVTYVKLKELIRQIALHQGMSISVDAVAKKAGLAGPTARALIQAFSALFLIREAGNKRFYIEDAGLSHFLVPNEMLSQQQLLRTFFYRELLALLHYRYSRSFNISYYDTRGGADVPFIVSDPIKGRTVAFTMDADTMASEKSLKSLGSFRRTRSDARLIALHMGVECYVASSGVWCVPLSWLF